MLQLSKSISESNINNRFIYNTENNENGMNMMRKMKFMAPVVETYILPVPAKIAI